ncbi:Predicted esterase [Serratia plymuthica]|nr:Predicted esterase [Serratia plymuthica]
MQHLLKEVDKAVQQEGDQHPLICGVGLGGFWAERIGFLCGIRQAIFNPNLYPEEHMHGKSTGRKSTAISPPSASRISAKRTAIAAW